MVLQHEERSDITGRRPGKWVLSFSQPRSRYARCDRFRRRKAYGGAKHLEFPVSWTMPICRPVKAREIPSDSGICHCQKPWVSLVRGILDLRLWTQPASFSIAFSCCRDRCKKSWPWVVVMPFCTELMVCVCGYHRGCTTYVSYTPAVGE